MAISAKDLVKYDGKQVILHLVQEDGSAKEMEGKVEAASEAGMAFKEKGKRDVELIMPSDIEEIAFAPEKPKRITQKKLKPVTVTNVRQHLVDRHGMSRSEANSITDEEALELHDQVDHKDLGHKHVSDEDENEGDSEGSDSEESAA